MYVISLYLPIPVRSLTCKTDKASLLIPEFHESEKGLETKTDCWHSNEHTQLRDDESEPKQEQPASCSLTDCAIYMYMCISILKCILQSLLK